MKRASRYLPTGVMALVLPFVWAGVSALAQDAGTKTATAGCAMCQQLMPGGDIAKLADQVAASSAAIAKETDTAILKKKLAEHAKLTKTLQAKVKEHGEMMQKMMGGGEGGMCPMMNMGGMNMGGMKNMPNMPTVTPVNPDPDMSSMPGHHM